MSITKYFYEDATYYTEGSFRARIECANVIAVAAAGSFVIMLIVMAWSLANPAVVTPGAAVSVVALIIQVGGIGVAILMSMATVAALTDARNLRSQLRSITRIK